MHTPTLVAPSRYRRPMELADLVLTRYPWLLFALAALPTYLGARLFVHRLREAHERWRARRRLRRGARAERRALHLLRRAGYRILDAQLEHEWTVRCDGEPVSIALRADYLVERDSRRYIAEVKSGRTAPRIEHADTRRQLLEYDVAYDVDGVLLVDMEARRIRRVDFCPEVGARPTERGAPLSAMVLGALVGAVCTALVLLGHI
jgi:hypothetical protein